MMVRLVDRARVAISMKIGRCGRCMRLSLRGAVAGWIVLIAVSHFAPRYGVLVSPWPISFTALWLLHIGTYGVRAARTRQESAETEGGAHGMTRRALFLRFAGAASFAVLVSATLPEISRAQSSCVTGYHLCADRQHCCANGYNYACPTDICTNETGKCRSVTTAEDLKSFQSCCPTGFAC